MTQTLPNSVVHWCWIGAVTNNQVTIKAKIREDIINQNQYIQIKYSTDSRFFETQGSLNSLRGVQAASLVEQIATFNINNLEEDIRYYYVIIAGGRRYPENHGEYLTFKTVKIHQKYNFAIGCSSCAGRFLDEVLIMEQSILLIPTQKILKEKQLKVVKNGEF